MKASTAAFWIFMVLIIIVGIVFSISLIKPHQNNVEIIKSFAAIMERVLLIAGSGWFGIKIGEKTSTLGDRE